MVGPAIEKSLHREGSALSDNSPRSGDQQLRLGRRAQWVTTLNSNSAWSIKVPEDRMGLVPLCNAEPTQRCGRQCAVGRGTSEEHPAYTQRPGQT